MENKNSQSDSRDGKQFYVSPSGNDRAAGTVDAPLASLTRAREAAREWASAHKGDDVTVFLAGGEYPLAETLVFGPEHGGADGHNMTYAAAPGERPVLSAGRHITGWSVRDGHWVVTLPEVANGDWDFIQLFVNGERRLRPRLPRDGYYYAAAQTPSTPQSKEGAHDRFVYMSDELKSSWHNLSSVEVHLLHEWSTSRLPLLEVDEPSKTATVAGGSTRHAIVRGTRYLVENVKEAQMAGEWYLDRTNGELTYYPLPGEDPGTAVVIAPYLHRLIEIKGDVAANAWVENLNFVGITFAHCNWTTPPLGNSIPQAESDMPAGVVAEGARNCTFRQCNFTLMGGYCLELGDGCQNDLVESCTFTDVGAGGVRIGPTRTDDQDIVASHNTVRDCLLAHLGRVHPSGVGILVMFGHHIVVEHNHIFDLYYTGISMGWTWNYDPTPNHDNVINYNHIHDALQLSLTDGAGIYTLGRQIGSVMRGNVIHDIEGVPWAVGIYLDQASTGWLCEDNLVYRITTHDFNVNFGRENIARNNIFGPILDPGAPLLRCGTMEDHLSMTVEKNLIYYTVGDLVDEVWPSWPVDKCLIRSNLYWNAAGYPVKFRDRSWTYWQSTGQDKGSIIADPLFVDPDNGDFRLKPGSPASRIGFKPFDYSKAGRLTQTEDEPKALYPRAYPKALWNPPFTLQIPESDPVEP